MGPMTRSRCQLAWPQTDRRKPKPSKRTGVMVWIEPERGYTYQISRSVTIVSIKGTRGIFFSPESAGKDWVSGLQPSGF